MVFCDDCEHHQYEGVKAMVQDQAPQEPRTMLTVEEADAQRSAESAAIVPAEQVETALAKISAEMVPAADVESVDGKAADLVAQLTSSPGNELQVLSMAQTIGTSVETSASRFLKTRPLSDLRELGATGPESTLPAQMSKLRVEADKINPDSIRRRGFAGFVRRLGLAEWADKLTNRALQAKYEHLGSIMDGIRGVVNDMRMTQTHVAESNIQLEEIDQEAKLKVIELRKALLVLKAVAERIKAMLEAAAPGSAEQAFLTKVLNQVMIRIQYVMLAENMLVQFRVMIVSIHDANRPVIDALGGVANTVEATAPMGATVMMMAQDQERAINVAKAGMDLATGVLESAASATERSVKGAAAMARGELINLDRIGAAHERIIAAATELQQAYAQGTANVEAQIPVFEKMNQELAPHLSEAAKVQQRLEDRDPLAPA